MKSSMLAIIFSLFFVVSASAAEQSFKIKSYDWDGAIPSSGIVVVKNAFGSIRSRSNSEEKVFLHATYQKIGKNGLKPSFDISESDGKLYIEVKYDRSITSASGQLLGRTDLSVLFPPSVKIVAETTDGMIKIDKTGSDIEAITDSGSIKLTTSGLFNAKSNSGTIALRLRGMHTAGVSLAHSNSGNISTTVFDDMDIDLTARTNGAIFYNGSAINPKEFFRKQGSAASVVELQSVTGNVKVDIIEPPKLVKSVKPTKKDIDIRTLPKSKDWKPGDPVKEINPKRTGKKKSKSGDND